jgi:hypothetical protein
MRLDDSLERLANRGPHRDPLAVITEVRDGVSVLDSTDMHMEMMELDAVDGAGRYRRALTLTAAAVVILVGAAGIMMRNRGSEPIVFSQSTAEPSLPSPLTEAERTTGLTRCVSQSRAESEPTGVVDARPEGLLVGVSATDTWLTCFFPSDESAQISLFPIGLASGEARPNALLPEVSPSRPIVVVGASGQKGIDGPDGSKVIKGSEVTWVWGRIDPSIASVIVTTRSAQYVPTITNGLFAAWWRGNNSDQTVVRGFDAAGNEVAFVDQVNCYAGTPVNVEGGTYTPPTRRLVVNGTYIEGGCIGGEHAKPGATASEIRDGK